jgi:DNA-binding transcriptional LysR family regulator
VLEDSRTLQEEANALSTLRSGNVRVGGTPILNNTLLVSAILECQQLYPNVHFEVTEGGSFRLIESVVAGDLELAAVNSVEDLSDNDQLIARRLWTDDVFVCVPRSHRLAGARGVRLAEIKDNPWVICGWDYMPRQLLGKLTAGMDINVVYNAVGGSATVHMVARGIGITLATRLAIDTADPADRERVVALPITGQAVPQVHTFLLRRRGIWPTPASRELERLVMGVRPGSFASQRQSGSSDMIAS